VLVGLIEGQSLGLPLAGTRERQSAVLVAFFVEEDDAGARFRPAPQRIRLAADHRIRHARTVRQRHTQRAVLLDDIDALDVDLLEVRPLSRERQQQHRDDTEKEPFGRSQWTVKSIVVETSPTPAMAKIVPDPVVDAVQGTWKL